MAKKPVINKKSAYLKEHEISKLLWEAGFTDRHDVANAIHVGYARLPIVLTNPKAHLTCSQLEIVAFLTDKPIAEIFRLVMTGRKTKKLKDISTKELKIEMAKGKNWFDLP